MKTMLTVMMFVGVAATAGAQQPVTEHEHQARAAFEKQLQVLLEQAPSTGLHVTLEMHPVTGAPYSGETVTESVQTLADGNRIVRRSVVRVFRDSAGRTRREMVGADGQVTSIVISNLATGVSYMLQPSTGTARRTAVVTSYVSSGGTTTAHVSSGGVAGGVAEGAAGGGAVSVYVSSDPKSQAEAKALQEAQVRAHLTTGQSGVSVAGPLTVVSESHGPGSTTKEDLGQQAIEGVLAKGTRSTTVIPAGAIGNEQPITIVSEEWTSPELKVLVMTKHVDPRVGETTYRLTNVSRSEPAAALFEVPAGYTVK